MDASPDLWPTDILTVQQMYAADAAAAALGIESYALMTAAGEAVAREVVARWSKRPVAILCGPGLNGGDGYVAARALTAAGWSVRVLALGEPQAKTDAARALSEWKRTPMPLSAGLGEAELVIDALFGAGLSRPIPEEAAGLLEDAEQRGLPIVAVDLPSGLHGDTARPLEYAPRAALTVTFHRKKPAHVLEPGAGYCGDVVVADIGIPPFACPDAPVRENVPGHWVDAYPWPGRDTHKHARGRLGVIGGPRHQTGAARLAARAGLRIAGTVRVYADPSAADIYASALEAAMLKAVRSPEELGDLAREMDAFVIGPAAGLTDTTRVNLAALKQAGVAVVADADALAVFKDDPRALFELLDDRDVMTPHPGEFERLFPGLLDGSRNRIDAALKAAATAGCTVLLKGPDTIIASNDGRAIVNTHATPWLATAGSGDVLAGIIGGLLAGGMQPFEAGACGAWVHGDAGRRFGPGLTAEDLPDQLPAVIARLANRPPPDE